VSVDNIRLARAADVDRLDAALRRLSAELGDIHRATAADLLRHGFGDDPAFAALLAEREGTIRGVVMFSPVFSTIRGATGLYVSDLWVAREARGSGLAQRLLAAAQAEAAGRWGTRFLRLAVYDDNPRARAFYDRLGFRANPRETLMTLEAAQPGETR
jgi:ribosomal protein S18 acetylase RimI-like enzyme